ncbi:DUF2156 domain-containing protein [Actinosynnema sp. ALI-1.44]|uniref:DUF2156 domain-containing protein n=1 Tax=Actinosynnema sp. ALI-1.44 TaxID=1933779 RepID=UPI0009FDCA32|nr:DUF2156 domain-containing protein [Actinosynnema sp. ALI-1.44]
MKVLLRRAPFTVVLVVVVWTVAILTKSLSTGPSDELIDRVGFGPDQFSIGHWWSPVSSMFFSGGLSGYVWATLLIAWLCGLAEMRIGTIRTAVIFVVTHILGTSLAAGMIALSMRTGDWWPTGLAVEVDPAVGAIGVGFALSFQLTPTWRRRLRVVLSLALVMCALYIGSMVDLARLFAVLPGLLAGAVVAGRKWHTGGQPSSVETRLLVALVVAASAVGPLVATVTQTANGPLSVLQSLFVGDQPDAIDLEYVCGDPSAVQDCQNLRALLRMSGVGSAILSIVPVLLLLVLAEGLRRGRKFAWWVTAGLNIALTWLGVLLLMSYPADALPTTTQDWIQLLVPLAQPLVIVVLLLATRKKFRVSAPPGTYMKFAVITLGTVVACCVIYVGGAWLLRDQFESQPGLHAILADLPTRFAPPGYLGLVDFAVVPTGWWSMHLHHWIGVVFWAVVIIGGLVTFRKAIVERRAADRSRARELLAEYGGSSMSHMITWRGNDYWFTPDGKAVIAYRVISAVALTTGEPVGEAESKSAAVQQFTQFCATNGWTPCFYSVGESLRTELSSWSSVQVAEETVVPLPGLEFRGKKWQDVRTAMNKAGNFGVTAQWTSYRDAPPWMTEQIAALSDAWLADKGLPEMGFTLGTLEELADDEVRCLVAVDEDRKVHGVTSWLPVRQDGEIVAWTLDFMRRSNSAFTGVMEFLIASMAIRCRDEGVEYISLSGAPLARRRDRGEKVPLLQRLLDVVGRLLEPVYGFRSLLAFKAKFQPQYRPLFMSYPDASALPSIGNAITKAYLPRITLRQAGRLAGKLIIRRYPR